MPLREDLLQPIAGENPSGKSLRYDRVYDQIKEARTEDDDSLPAGAWERQSKRADYNLVIKLGGEALATKSKDLQLAAWLGEAHIKREGVALLSPVLQLFLDLQKQFWETIYPEIDEGDTGLRAVPLQWAANRYATLVYEFPISKGGMTYFTYKSARALGYAADAENNEAKTKARDLAVKRGQLTAEDVDEGIAGTPKSLYANLDPMLQECRDVLEELAVYCEESYGEDGPSFRKLRDSLEEVHNLVHSLLSEKRKLEPDAPVAVEEEPAQEPAPVAAEPEPQFAAPIETAAPAVVAAVPIATAAVPVRAAPSSVGAGSGGPPSSWDDAAARVHSCARYMSGERPGSAVPYLLHSALRWGELRKHAPKPPLDLLVAPPSEVRSGLKMAASEKSWSQVLPIAMGAMMEPCARCWIDLHRYIWSAASGSGYTSFASMVMTSVRQILREFPDMAEWSFSDDTPVANADTIRWLSEEVGAEDSTTQATASTAPAGAPAAPKPVVSVVLQPSSPEDGSNAEEGQADVFAEASALAGSGQLHAAASMLARDAEGQRSGRMRFRRRVEIAELCLAAGSNAVAVPILRELVAEIEQRQLNTWESGDTVARPLSLLLQVTSNGDRNGEWTAHFARLCALDPVAALSINPQLKRNREGEQGDGTKY